MSPKIQLKKLLKKTEIISIIQGMINALNTHINIVDREGNLLFGQVNKNLSHQFSIKAGHHIIGWVKGEETAGNIAEFLNYVANQEYEKKTLAIETLEKYEEINFLYDISEQIAKCLKVEEVTQVVINEVKKLIEATYISVILINSKTQELEIFAIDRDEYQKKSKTIKKLGIASHVLHSGKAEIVNDVLADPRYTEGTTKLRSLICAPLTIQNETIGVINISHSKPLKYTAEDLKLLTALTSQAAAAIQAAQYYQQLKEYSQTLEQKVAERTLELENAKQELEKANLELENLATIDQLTQLANRRKFDEYLESEWRRMIREQQPLSLILCDVDYFKFYNDYYGHPTGDECLKKIAMVLKQVVKRSGDLVARYGGEEFAIILSNTNAQGAVKVSEDIQVAVQDLKVVHCLSVVSSYVTVSSGIASLSPGSKCTPEDLLEAADKGLYQAKRNGRNCYILYQSNCDQE